MAILIVFPKFQQHTKNVLSAIWRSWFPILALMQYGVFWMLSAKIVISKPTKKNLISVSVTFISWLLFFKFSLTHFLLMSLIPGILLYFVMVEVVNLPHHLQMNFNTDDARLPAWQQEVTARTCKYPKWISQYITLNFNYHVEHHLFPDAPWFTLENIHHDLVNSKQVSYVVDEGFQWIIENKNNSLDQVLKTATKFDHKISNAS